MAPDQAPGDPRWGPATTYRARHRRGPSGVPAPAGRREEPARRQDAADPWADRGDRRPAAPSAAPPRRPAAGRPGRQAPPPPPPRGRRRSRGRRVVLLLIAVLVGYPLALGLTGYLAVDRTGPLPESALPGTPGRTVLLVGSDSREDLTEEERAELSTGGDAGRRTDTIMLLHSPLGGGPTVLLSLPRDSYVDIPGSGENKINAAYAFGGPDLLVRTVEDATGLRVDGYVETGLAGFAAVVDAVGGVEQCPEQAIVDPKAGLDIEAGCQQMDGATALGYARTRDFDPRGDLGRAERQRGLIAAIAAKAASPSTLLNPLRAFPAARAGGEALRVDDGTGPVDLGRFALAVRAASGGDAVSLTVPVADATRRTNAGIVVDWDDERAEQVFDALRRDDTEAVRAIAEEQAALLGG